VKEEFQSSKEPEDVDKEDGAQLTVLKSVSVFLSPESLKGYTLGVLLPEFFLSFYFVTEFPTALRKADSFPLPLFFLVGRLNHAAHA